MKLEWKINRINCAPGEYILQPSTSNNVNELDNLSLEEALQLAGISDLNVSIEKKTFVTCRRHSFINFLLTLSSPG